MKKIKYIKILCLLFFVVPILVFGFSFPINNNKISAKNDTTLNEDDNEINVGDDTCGYCMTLCTRNGGKDCASACAYACPRTTTYYCCCNASRSLCYNSTSCLSPYQTTGVNISDSECSGKVVHTTPTPSSEPAPVNNCKIQGMSRFNVMSIGSTNTVTVGVAHCSGAPKVTGSGGISAYGVSKLSDEDYTFTIKATGKCDEVGAYSVSIGGQTVTQKVLIINYWRENHDVTIYHLPSNASQSSADLTSDWEYGFGCRDNGDGSYTCATYGWRSCGGVGTAPSNSVPAQVNLPNETVYGCYANAKSLDKATKAEWRGGVTSGLTHKIDKLPSGIPVTADTCIPFPQVKLCEPAQKEPYNVKGDTSAKACERDATVKYDDGVQCSGSSFYDISCSNTMTIQYDSGDDKNKEHIKENYKVLSGQGIAFGITVKNVRTCKATFNEALWNKAKKKKKKQRDAINKSKSSLSGNNLKTADKLIAQYNNMLSDLLGFVNEYNSYYTNKGEKLLKGVELGANIKFSYATTDGTKDENKDYIIESDKVGSGKITNAKSYKLNDEKKTAFKEYDWTNKSDPRVVKFVFPVSYINRNTGEAVSGTTIDKKTHYYGGNKIYIANNAIGGFRDEVKATKNMMNITVFSPIKGKTKNISVLNNQCALSIYNSKLVYRPISLDNPFINSSYAKGENWTNDVFDFTKVIKEATWATKAQFDIIFNATAVNALKNSNTTYQSSFPYKGLCNRISSSMQNPITKKLCDCLSKQGTKCNIIL